MSSDYDLDYNFFDVDCEDCGIKFYVRCGSINRGIAPERSAKLYEKIHERILGAFKS
jgi:hypothetical protein